ncbi:hypothetical protein Osc7112_6775 (plasmid) [Oscillatoria nigro-viridis PCC 7112]|uniref:Uncharacterized protein n=1 Tax=Phormidium nigroviride PCC 7112 TaxID=179408 RepID=K9VTQ4_9CYAN|nr:hypothetical protein [Oscillatoria nigro-viridis]AFZ10867.1 hypothetical protein Osc7112_6775 [Oscillatoria nigro-viridis PCC 7112]
MVATATPMRKLSTLPPLTPSIELLNLNLAVNGVNRFGFAPSSAFVYALNLPPDSGNDMLGA